MAKNKQAPNSAPPAVTNGSSAPKLPAYLFGLLAVIASAVALWPVLQNSYISWDDNVYFYENDYLTRPLGAAISHFFSGSLYLGAYTPVTLSVLAIISKLAGSIEPGNFHTAALVLHLINVFLVFLFTHRLAARNTTIAFFSAALFGLHPMHVESVAWAAEFKDVLFTSFYLAGLLTWLRATDTQDKATKWLVITCLLFILSLLSKPAAVTFPIVLLLLQWYQQKSATRSQSIAISMMVVLSVIIGVVTIYGQSTYPHMQESHNLLQRFVVAAYAYVHYYISLVWPTGMSIFYPYPALVDGNLSGLYYLYLLPAAALLFVAWFFRKSAPYVTFGIGFFTINILLVLQILSPGMSAMADHYTYLSYLGLIFAVLALLNTLIKRASSVKALPRIATGLGLAVLIVFGTLANTRVRHWQNDETMANELLGQYPSNYVALNNMGFVLHSQGQSAPAITYCMQAISQKKDYPYPYVNAINAAIALSDINFAAGLADSAARFVKPTPDILNSIGYVALLQNRLDDAIVSYKKTIALQPTNRNAYLALAEIYYRKKDYTTEINILNKGLKHLPDNPIMLNYKGYALYTTGRYQDALIIYDKVLSIAPDYKGAAENREQCLKAMNASKNNIR